LRERVKEEKKANQVNVKEGPKSFRKGRGERPIQITKEVHAEPQLQKEP